MRLNRFDLNLLLVLDALLETRNVTRASEQLHISQSGASAALNRLRDYFEDPLLVPVGRRLTLTPLAQELIEPVREALLQVKAALSRRPGFEPATAERHFVVCASDYVITVLLASVVQHLSRDAPGVSLDLRSPPRDIEQAFDRGTIDLLVMPRQYAERLDHPQMPLFEDSHVCLAWREHPHLDRPLTLERYMALDHMTVRFGDERSVSFEEWFLPRYGQQRRVVCSVDSFGTLPLLLVGTERVATVHRRLAEHSARALPLQLLALPFDMPPLLEVMVWPRHLEADPAHAWLRDLIRRCALTLDGDAAVPGA
jgi:LysR family transcriptional regulator, nod-box dependent transcriptional activator